MKTKTTSSSRRAFIKRTALGVAGAGLALDARSYANIIGANDRMQFAVVGLNGRGKALWEAVADAKNTRIAALCDVDSRILPGIYEKVKKKTGAKAKLYSDIRKLLENKNVDAVVIATPDHWHAPMTIMAVQAGKHVYVEKPCSYNPDEGEMLVKAQKKYDKVIQMGNQQRSAITSKQAVNDIREGAIGRPYYGKAWYANGRASIGHGKKTAVPQWLDWELWQGPAPRRQFKDNIVHYNWHWFDGWGTGEINNNGTHEIDICRWALGVDYPSKVSSSGGRYHFKDDWEFYDTQVANFEFPDGKMITWEGKSCNRFNYFGRGRGATIHGTDGSVLLDRNTYELYDANNKLVKRLKEDTISATTDTVGKGGLDLAHMSNFIDTVRHGTRQNSPIIEGHKSNLLCHLGNISQKLGRTLKTDTNSGRILNDDEAMQLWKRSYEPGWELQL